MTEDACVFTGWLANRYWLAGQLCQARRKGATATVVPGRRSRGCSRRPAATFRKKSPLINNAQ